VKAFAIKQPPSVPSDAALLGGALTGGAGGGGRRRDATALWAAMMEGSLWMGTITRPDMGVTCVSARLVHIVRVYSQRGAHVVTHPSWRAWAYRMRWMVRGGMELCDCHRRGPANAAGR